MEDDCEDSRTHVPDAGPPVWGHGDWRKGEDDDDDGKEEYEVENWRASVAEGLSAAWRRLDAQYLRQPKKTRVTLRIDSDVLDWYRKRGRGHQSLMNATLRAFMAASREAHWGISDSESD